MRTMWRTMAAGLGLALIAGGLVAAGPATAASTLTNAGFEANGGTQTPSGWSEYSATGQQSASYTEAGGRTGSYRLSHWAAGAYQVETYQHLDGLVNGSYTARAWVRSGGGQVAAYLALRNCGGAEQRTNLPITGTWTQISVTTTVTGGQCTVSIVSNARAGTWINVDDVEFVANGGTTPPPAPTGFIRGADVSTLKKSEDRGGVYRDSAGNQRDALQLLQQNGVNYGRLKVWVNPADGYNNRARVLTMASRIKGQGMRLLVDFHYSDTWADPGKQYKPAAWNGYTFTHLRDAVYNHTYDVLNALRAQGTPADMVQVGNEINDGMLWPDGRSNNFANLAQLLTAGSNAVKAVNSATPVMLHLAEGGNNTQHRWWFDQATSRGVPFDVIGLSHYLYWHGSIGSLQSNMNDLASRYGKPIVVVETAYGFTLNQDDSEPNIFNSSLQQAGGYPATPQGQADALRAVFNAVKAVPNGRGLGVFYWEPTWTAVTGNGWDPDNPSSGNGWENQALFDYNDRALPALSVFSTV
ncbi:arabinogalactan endo-1,4-beta-galactosidase [Micromonospora rosaria]|uniref:Arabinogalactan endo-beta-1,4-galactanase n=1 Tax=Micromonospora rosaria TaxID=47874 RepID=A0A136PXI1_9ACTN|nr:arabinogalactan endo-1,4-beta-galactosidase [Micromonospora rosaria]KXK63067.1 arabinogalactan endo-1,4-beta-galactosidase [Micromonospora rosaria]